MMSDLRTGDKLSPPGMPDSYLEVLDPRIHAGAIQFFDSSKRESRYVDEAFIRAGIADGRLILHRRGMSHVGITAQYDNPALHARVRLLHDVLRRIQHIKEERGLSFDAAIPFAREAWDKSHTDKLVAHPFPSRATLFRARKQQQRGLPVLKGDKNKGNQTPRYSRAFVDFVEDLIKGHYLVTESRWTVKDLTDHINREARRRELYVGRHTISRKFVASKIRDLTVDPEYDRMDPLNRVAAKSYAKHRIRAGFPFARIEQDALHLPFVVQTPHGIARTVYLVHAIDCCTGYPVGWQLVIGAPREMDSLRCLEMYLTPAKAARFEELGIDHELNLFGTPAQVIFDNGPETRGGRIVRLELLGIDVKHCKAKEAQGKPFIERLNKSLKEALQRLGGCTRFEGVDGKRDPVALGDELMTVDELEVWIVRWLYESWVNHPLERLLWDELLVESVKGKTPLERLKYMTEEMGHPITMPPPRHEWMKAMFDQQMCTLSAKTGISVHGFRYKGDAMSYLLSKYGDGAPLEVVYNPDDFREVYVHEDDSRPLVTLTHEHVRPDSPAWTFAEAKDRIATGLSDWTEPEARVQFQRDLDDAVTKPGRGRKPGRRSKREENSETVARAKDYAAIERTFDRPLSADPPFGPAPSANPALPAAENRQAAISYDDAPVMNIVNRNTGEKLL